MTTTTDRPRHGKAYVWPTWITRLLSGENKCYWAAWYRAHYKYAKREDGQEFDRDQWTKTHDGMVDAHAAHLDRDGWLCGIESDNKFDLEGNAATLGGQPDIVARHFERREAVVVDAKSGRARESDVWQVKTYLFAMPLSDPTLADEGWRLTGEVLYRGMSVAVSLNESDRNRIVATIKQVGGSDAPPRVPSVSECRFCDIASCPDRALPRTTDVSGIF